MPNLIGCSVYVDANRAYAQSQPKYTEPEFQTSLDRDALATLGQPMYDWRFKPTAFE